MCVCVSEECVKEKGEDSSVSPSKHLPLSGYHVTTIFGLNGPSHFPLCHAGTRSNELKLCLTNVDTQHLCVHIHTGAYTAPIHTQIHNKIAFTPGDKFSPDHGISHMVSRV